MLIDKKLFGEAVRDDGIRPGKGDDLPADLAGTGAPQIWLMSSER